MASVSSERIAVGGGNDDEPQRLLPFLLFIFIYDFLFSANLLPSSIPPPLNPPNRQVDDCITFGVGKKIMRNRAHVETLAIFYSARKWREIRQEGGWWRGRELMFF